MHGLRCSPALLGWTRLLDEWVVGLTQFNPTSSDASLCWEDAARTRETLARAAERTQGFAYHDDDRPRVIPEADGVLRFELQGCNYCVASVQWSPRRAAELRSADPWLGEALAIAAKAAVAEETPVGVVIVTPRLPPDGRDSREAVADALITESREIRLSGAAFSFPTRSESDRYRYANDEYPGALLLVRTAPNHPSISA